ncbi:hypothetical protein FIBSPDRAFT_857226 [Athelia psychrophila]|uniref:Carbamoyl phosphate synthase ATP-binding domain-containing protein n=1 Tax=Athelia psychrophila TaxID=1759441 RepID=A0A166MQ19_9AGAM|nr:hypothetical protein FIBSPDRAFT_857226 [Fibularhizoctonia sp. CBS 109695]
MPRETLPTCVNCRAVCNDVSRGLPRCRPPPSSTIPRYLVELLLVTSTKMARALRHQCVGAFEYLVNSHTCKWVFLEINPRIQIRGDMNHDLMRIQP